MWKCTVRAAVTILILSAAIEAKASIYGLPSWLSKRHIDVGDWRLDVITNHFSGDVACRLRSRRGRMRYQANAVGFAFSKSWHVGEASYRIDGGDVQRSRADLPTLIANVTPVENGSMFNPSDGVVWVPYKRLVQANSITIQARPDRQPRLFRLTGLKGLYAIAVAHGCRPERRFVR